jgi:hypothetical protein
VLLGRPPGRRLIERLAGLLARPGGLLPVLPLAAVEVLRGSETGHGGWNDASYALFLVYGFLAAADPRIGQAFRRRYRAAMTLGGLGLADSRGTRPGTPRPSAPVRRLGVSVNDAVPAFYVLHPVARYLFGLKPIRGTIDP